MSQYQIDLDTWINRAFAIELSNNGKDADARTWLKAAPLLNTKDELIAVYLATNGDPSWLATFTPTGICIISAESESPEVWEFVSGEYCDVDKLENTIRDFLSAAKLIN